MRCVACDDLLTDNESTTKSSITGEYLDLCTRCLSTIRDDLLGINLGSGNEQTTEENETEG